MVYSTIQLNTKEEGWFTNSQWSVELDLADFGDEMYSRVVDEI